MALRFTNSAKPSGSNSSTNEDKITSLGTSALSSKERIIIALDFGTTYSGVAYCFGSSSEAKPVVDWLGLEGRTQPKVPTAIAYDPDDSSEFKWGGQLSWRDDHVQGVKLLLDPKQTRPSYLPSANVKSEMKKLPKSAVDVAADFIGAMYNHALERIGSRVPRDYLDLCEKTFVLSFPAVWSERAKESTIQAAKKAGVYPVMLIKEPEAAALYTFKTQERALSVGDCFVVCDAGGGTVDLISYEVVATEPTLDLAEAVPGSGNMSGSLGLNKRFAEAVKNLIGEEEWLCLKNTSAWAKAEHQFDQEIKTAFAGDLDEEYVVNFPGAHLPDDEDEGLRRDSWFIETVQEIFEPLIADIVRLVREQVQSAMLERPDQPVKGIFLVGGFGASQYLKARLEESNPDIQVIQPEDAWAAIVKGAALSRLSQTNVISTKATHHYGVKAWFIYEPVTDKGQPIIIGRVDGEIRTERMEWYIRKGENLRRDRDERYSYIRHIPRSYTNNDLQFEDELWISDTVAASTHPTGEIKVTCVLESDLSSVNKSLFKKVRGIDGRKWWKVSYDLVISTREAAMKFWLEFDGKEAGAVMAKYD
ncbi:related to hsp70 protein [Fusarium fujikuroi IMI 58289]|uniref:Related to hsp70 protein n=1 Tax=Gibberella fujikuroi (strain CBS 195.34 / IMI 58289 / NRRL A-6831) TaxID=1279085 RepID=S0DLB5_GIBF5|nr:related to hsp70 protein [Fusarium fujikuroi IMI 58289]CCT63195.1 related to hsp70 protein [Fusarium fujikuroi IMI 58289]SCN71584.1 related to hsp70 protein [Fusarium fujikuroi]